MGSPDNMDTNTLEEFSVISEDDSKDLQGNDAGISSKVEKVTSLFAKTNLHNVPSSKVYEVSPEERTTALQDVHGAVEIVEETPEVVQAKLSEIDRELRSVQDAERRAAFDEAMKINPAYVESIRITTLRADNFDASKAALRLMDHFKARLALFGTTAVLGRDIRLSDFDEDDLYALKKGLSTVLPNRDQVGRPILFMNPRATADPNATEYRLCSFKSQLRLLFWQGAWLARLGDEVQRKGICVIWFGMGSKQSPEHHGRGERLFHSFLEMPIKVSSIHACCDDRGIIEYCDKISAAAAAKYVLRFRTHLGSHVECRYSLMTYGIPLEIIPINADGTLNLDDHKRWLAEVERQERADQKDRHPTTKNEQERVQQPQSTVVEADASEIYLEPPGPMDVVLGRGQRGNKSPGNLLLKRLLEENMVAHFIGTRSDKTLISQQIYKTMREAGCRFLAPAAVSEDIVITRNGRKVYDRSPPELWVEVDELAARDRIAHRFRNLRPPPK